MMETKDYGKPCVVIIEDNPGDVDILRIALDRQQEPYDLVALSDGAEALGFVQSRRAGAREPEPCVILLNVHLPKYDGLEVLAALRNEPSLNHVQVVMLSSGDVRPGEEAVIRSWGAEFRQKPTQLSEAHQLGAEIFELCKKGMVYA